MARMRAVGSVPGWRRWAEPRVVALALLITMLAIARIVSPTGASPDSQLLILVAGISAYLVTSRWIPVVDHPQLVCNLLTLASGGLCLLWVLGTKALEGTVWLREIRRAYHGLALSGTINENVLAGALVMLVPFCLSAALPAQGTPRVGRVGRLVAASVSVATVSVLWLTASRGGWVAASVGMLLWLVLRRPRAAIWLFPVFFASLMFVATVVGWRTALDMLMSGSDAGSLDRRLEIWSRAVYIIRDYPVTGVGLDGFETVVASMYPLFLEPRGTISHAHNLYLQVAVDLGLPGLCAYLVLLSSSLFSAGSCCRDASVPPSDAGRILAAACVSSLGGMAVHGLIDNATWGNKAAPLPWFVMGLSAALCSWHQCANAEPRARSSGSVDHHALGAICGRAE